MKTIPERIEDNRVREDALLAIQPEFPQGTPEYDAYAKALRAELAKFSKGEAPYEFGI